MFLSKGTATITRHSFRVLITGGRNATLSWAWRGSRRRCASRTHLCPRRSSNAIIIVGKHFGAAVSTIGSKDRVPGIKLSGCDAVIGGEPSAEGARRSFRVLGALWINARLNR